MFKTIAILLMTTQTPALESGYLGIDVADEDGRVVVTFVEPEGPARYLRVGDTIEEVDGIPVQTKRAFSSVLRRTRPGDSVEVVIWTPTGSQSHRLLLGRKPAPKGVAVVHSGQPPLKAAGAKRHLVLSAQGPGNGESGISIGAAYSDRRPFMDFKYVQGMSDVLSLDLELTTYGVQNQMDLGLRFHVISTDAFSLAFRVRAHEEHYFDGADLVMASFSPGALISFGSEKMQWTLGLDAHIYMFGWVEGTPGQVDFVAYGFRPFVGFEYAVVDSMNVFAQAQIRTMQFDGFDTILEPGFSAGVAW